MAKPIQTPPAPTPNGPQPKDVQVPQQLDTAAQAAPAAPYDPLSLDRMLPPVPGAPVGPPPLAPQYRGIHRYRLTERCFRGGVMLEPGTVVVVTDEKPGRTWVCIDDEVAPKAAPGSDVLEQTPTPTQRPADKAL